VKQPFGRDIRLVDAADLILSSLTDAVAVKGGVEGEVLPGEHITASAETEESSHSNISEPWLTTSHLDEQTPNTTDATTSAIENSCASSLATGFKLMGRLCHAKTTAAANRGQPIMSRIMRARKNHDAETPVFLSSRLAAKPKFRLSFVSHRPVITAAAKDVWCS
jgi:hypothetical protein